MLLLEIKHADCCNVAVENRRGNEQRFGLVVFLRVQVEDLLDSVGPVMWADNLVPIDLGLLTDGR